MKKKIIQWLMILSLIFPLLGGCGGVAYADDSDSVQQGLQVSDLLGYWSGWAYKGISDIQKNGKGKDGTNETSIRKGFSKRNAFMIWSFMSPGSKGTGSSLTGAGISFQNTNVTYKSLVANMPSNGASKYLTNYVKPMFMYRYVLEQNGLLAPANSATSAFSAPGHWISGGLLYIVVLADNIVQSALKIVLGLIATLNPFVGIMYLTGNSNYLKYVSSSFTDKTAIKGKKQFSISNLWSGIAGKTNNGNSLVSIYKAIVGLMVVINIILLAVGIGKAIMGAGKDAGDGGFGKRLGRTIWKYLSRITIIAAAPILIGIIGATLINKVAGVELKSTSTQTASIIYGNFVNTEQWAVNSRFALPDMSGISKSKKKHYNSDSINNLATSTHLYASPNPSNLTKQYILTLNAKNAGLTGAGKALQGKTVGSGQTWSDLLGAYMGSTTFSRQDLDGAMLASISKDKKRAYADGSKSAIGQSQVFTYSDNDLKADNFQWYLNHLTKGEVTAATNGTNAKTNAEKLYTYTYGQNADGKNGVYNALFVSDGGLTIGQTKSGAKYYKQTAVTGKLTGSRLAPGTNSSYAGLSTAGAMNLLSITKSNSTTSYIFPVSIVGGQTGATWSSTRTVSLANVSNGWEGFFKIILLIFKALFSVSITVCVLILLANTSLRSVMDTLKSGIEVLRGDIAAIQTMLKDMVGMLLQMILGFMLIIGTNTIDDTVDNLVSQVTGAFVPSGTAIVNKGIVMGSGVSSAAVILSYIIQAVIYGWLMRVMFKDFNQFMRAVAGMFDRTIEKMGFNPGNSSNPVLRGLENGEQKLKDGIGNMMDKKDADDARKADISDKLDDITNDNNANALKKTIDDGDDKKDGKKSEIAKMAKEKRDKLKEENDKLAKEHQDLEDRLKDATNPKEKDDLKKKIEANEAEQEKNKAKMDKLDEIGNRAAAHKKDADEAKSSIKGRLKQAVNPNYADAKATYAANMRDLDDAHQRGQLSDDDYKKAKSALTDEYRKQTAHPLAKSLAKKAMAGGGLASEELLRKAINNPNGRLAKALDMATDGQFSEALKSGRPIDRKARQEMLQNLAANNVPLSKMTEAANSFVPKEQAVEAAKNLAEAKAGAESVAGNPQAVINQAQEAIKNGTATEAQKALMRNVNKAGRQTAIAQARKAVKNGTATEAQKALASKNPEKVIAQARAAVANGTATDLQKDIVREVAKVNQQTIISQAQEAVANGTATEGQKDMVQELAKGDPQKVIAQARKAVANGTATETQKNLVQELSKMPQAIISQAQEAVANGTATETQKNLVQELVKGETPTVIERAQAAVANGTATETQKNLVHDLSKMPQALSSNQETMTAIKSGDKAQAANAIITENKTMLDEAVKEDRVNDAIAIMRRINNEASQANIDVPQNIGHTEVQKMIEDVGRADAFRKSDMVNQPAVGKLAAAGIAPTSIHKTNVPQSQNTILEAAFGQEVQIPRSGGELITNEMIAKAPAATRAGLQEMQKQGVKIKLTGNALKQKPNIKEVKNAVIGLTTGYQGNPQQVMGGLDQRIVQAQAKGENIVQAVQGANIKTLAANTAGIDIAKDQAQTVTSYQTPAAVLAAKSVTSPTAPIDVDLATAYQLHGSTPSVAAAEKAWGKGGGVLIKGLEQSIAVKKAALEHDNMNQELQASLNTQVQQLAVLQNMRQSGAMPITQEEVNAVAGAYQSVDPSQTQTTIKYIAEKTVQAGKTIASSKASASSSAVGASTSTSRFLAGSPKKKNKLRQIEDDVKKTQTIQAKNEAYAKEKIAKEDSIFNPFRANSNPEIAKYEAERAARHANDHTDRFARQRRENARKHR